jgi:ribosome-associated toxin RatA of RatAB toxin-antitoxin module
MERSQKISSSLWKAGPLALAGVFCLGLIALLPFSSYGTPEEDEKPRTAIQVTEERMEGGRVAVRAAFRIEARPKTVFATLRDVVDFPEFMPDTIEVQILESGPGYHIARILSENGLLLTRVVMKRMFSEVEYRISWHQLEGQAKEVEGFWTVKEDKERAGSIVTFHSYVDAGPLVPKAIVREHIKKSISPMVASIEKRIESGGTWKCKSFIEGRKKG